MNSNEKVQYLLTALSGAKYLSLNPAFDVTDFIDKSLEIFSKEYINEATKVVDQGHNKDYQQLKMYFIDAILKKSFEDYTVTGYQQLEQGAFFWEVLCPDDTKIYASTTSLLDGSFKDKIYWAH